MSRLPTVGGDDNTWGDVLNDFLGVEHNADGTQKTLPLTKGGTGGTTAAAARTNLGAEASANKGIAGGYAPLDGTGKVPAGNLPGGGGSSTTFLINVDDYGANNYGAVTDGSFDNSTIVQGLINNALARSKPSCLYFPGLQYRFNTGLTVPNGMGSDAAISFRGSSSNWYGDNAGNLGKAGTVLFAGAGVPFLFDINNGSPNALMQHGPTFENMTICADNTQSNTTNLVRIQNVNHCTFRNVTFMPYRGIGLWLDAGVQVSFDTTANTVGLPGHGLSAGTTVYFVASGTLPGGITYGAPYYVVNPTTNAFQIALSSGGTAIDFPASPVPSGITSVYTQGDSSYHLLDNCHFFIQDDNGTGMLMMTVLQCAILGGRISTPTYAAPGPPGHPVTGAVGVDLVNVANIEFFGTKGENNCNPVYNVRRGSSFCHWVASPIEINGIYPAQAWVFDSNGAVSTDGDGHYLAGINMHGGGQSTQYGINISPNVKNLMVEGLHYQNFVDDAHAWSDSGIRTTINRRGGGRLQATRGPGYSASITPDAQMGSWQSIPVGNNTPFTINAPANQPSSSTVAGTMISAQSAELTLEFTNTSGGAVTNIGSATWSSTYVGNNGGSGGSFPALANPASNKSRWITFKWNGSKWIETARASADY